MSIVSAYLMPHPPIAIPQIGKGRERGISKTLASFRQASEEIAKQNPETIIYITPHSTGYSDYFHISPGESASGDLSRFGAPKLVLNVDYDTELADAITRIAEEMSIPAGTQGDYDPVLDHGVTVPMYFINESYRDYKCVRISLSGLEPVMHYRLGQTIFAAAYKLGRKTVVIASGDLSHKLTSDGPYGFAPEGPKFDSEVMTHLRNCDFLQLLDMDPLTREKAAECGYSSIAMMAGCFDGMDVEVTKMSYEGPFGVGYGTAKVLPGKPNAARNILEQYEITQLAQIEKKRASEDPYVSLARKSLEFTVKKEGKYILSAAERNAMPDEMRFERAGAFVSIQKNGMLRGCVGTISPTMPNIAEEIIQNAVSAGTKDNRFPPVQKHEIPFLTYKVDVLDAPESISGPEKLDVKQYGVIVESGHRRGLLLPNLDGVDTVAQQISIALNKAGINPNDEYSLKRFKVTRHEP